ncbi:MAG: zinc-dependent metalloprotease [Bacteroidetes bacterium]|nr:zinc-dependent metalloprotease [Bacteroidota bacterium]
MLNKAITTLLLAGTVVAVQAQVPQRTQIPGGMRPNPTGSLMGNAGGQRPAPKPYNEVITEKARTKVGLFTVHRVEDHYYFEIPDSILGRDILMESRLSKAGTDMRSGGSFSGYAGDQLNLSVIRLERGPENRIFLRDLSYSERSGDSTQPMFTAVMNSNIQPIAVSFDVKAYHLDSATNQRSTVIEMTDVMNSDNDMFFFGSSKPAFRIGQYQADKSYIVGVKTFPINTEIRTVKTYTKAANPLAGLLGGGGAAGPTGFSTVELNTSLVLLPKTPMQARFFDPRVGYFANSYTDFDLDPQGTKRVSMIARWRLEPKPEDMEKYKRGELVEPIKPIVIYIDPATPKKWVPYLIAGINDWQGAFEKAGFKNAIMGKLAPKESEDPTWSLEDAQHSALVYKPSSVANASGPHTSDPRSGEIIETHINWYHDVMKLVHDWYMIQTAAVDPRARKMEFDDELMGQLIRFVSSHEIGHTLGLRHNFGSSSATPVEKMRDKAWVEANGHTASIMDYARFNYVAQPGDNISAVGLFPRIGDYDKWAIEWGYKLIPDAKSPKAEEPILNKWVIEKLKDKRYWFGTEIDPDDPRAQSEDLGDDAMKASTYGIANLKFILPHLIEWTKEDNEDYEGLENMYSQLVGQLGRYTGHVAKNIGGRYTTPKTVEQGGPVYEIVPAATQKRAMEFLGKQIFATPTWLIDKKIISLTGVQPVSTIGGLQNIALARLLSTGTMSKLVYAEAVDPASYKLTEYFDDLTKYIWGEIATGQSIDIYRRNLQKTYVQTLSSILHPPAAPAVQAQPTGRGGRGMGSDPFSRTPADVNAVLKAHLAQLRTKIKADLPRATDAMTRYHLQDMVGIINEALKTKTDGAE